MFSTLLMGGVGHTREKDHRNVKSLIIFAHDCRWITPDFPIFCLLFMINKSIRGADAFVSLVDSLIS